jgi:hypothetical protein
MLMRDLTRILLEDARRDLAWLREDGYEERDSTVVGSAFDLRFSSPHGELNFSADLGRSEIVIVLSPPGYPYDHHVAIDGFLGARGHPLTDGYLGTQSVEAARKRVAAHTQARDSPRGARCRTSVRREDAGHRRRPRCGHGFTAAMDESGEPTAWARRCRSSSL